MPWQVYLVLRNVAKAFDKVWHIGLKFKLHYLSLPQIFEKYYNFLDNRSVQINIDRDFSNNIQLLSAVPQGGVPLAYII